MAEDGGFGYETFVGCVKDMVRMSEEVGDGWRLHAKEGRDNAIYVTKKRSQTLEDGSGGKTIAVFEYHVAYNVSYGVPVMCFAAWKQDGTLLEMEEYRRYNKMFEDVDIMSTLTQLDHPVLCRPFLTLHPCRTREVMEPFIRKSRNPVVSWLSAISPFLDLELPEEFIKAC